MSDKSSLTIESQTGKNQTEIVVKTTLLWETTDDVYIECVLKPEANSIALGDFGRSLVQSHRTEYDHRFKKYTVFFYSINTAERSTENRGFWSALFDLNKNAINKKRVFLDRFEYHPQEIKYVKDQLSSGFTTDPLFATTPCFIALHIEKELPKTVKHLTESFNCCFNDRLLLISGFPGVIKELTDHLDTIGIVNYEVVNIHELTISGNSLFQVNDWLTCYSSGDKRSVFVLA